MESEIGDLVIRPCTPPACVHQDYPCPIFRRRTLSTVAEKDVHEERGGAPRVNIECRPLGVSYLIYQDHRRRLQETLLSLRQERLLYGLIDATSRGRGIQAEAVHYSNRAIDLRRGALVHVYDRYGAVYVLSLNRHQVAVIWSARDRNPLPTELGRHRHPRPTVEQILVLRSITPHPGSITSPRPPLSCGLPRISIRRLILKLQNKKHHNFHENEQSSLSTVWYNDSFTSYSNAQATLTTAGLANNHPNGPVPRLSVKNLEGRDRKPSPTLRDFIKLALREDEDEVLGTHQLHNPTIAYGNSLVNASFPPSKKQSLRHKVKSSFRRSLRVMDLVRHKSRSAMQRVLTRRESAPPAVVGKIENDSEWVMDQPIPRQKYGVVALTEENLNRLREALGGDYQVVKPDCDVPENSYASSLAGNTANDQDGDDNESEDEANGQNFNDHNAKVHNQFRTNDDDDANDGQGSFGATQGRATEIESSTYNAQSMISDGSKDTTQDSIADKSPSNENIDDDITILIRILLLAHKRDPVTDIVPPPDFLDLMEVARKARLAEKLDLRKQAKRIGPLKPTQLIQPFHTENCGEGTSTLTKTSVPDQNTGKGASKQVTAGEATSAKGNPHSHQNDIDKASLPFTQNSIPAADEISSSKPLDDAFLQQDEEAVRAIADEIRRRDGQYAQENEIKDLRLVRPVFMGFYIAAPDPGQLMDQVQSNFSSWYSIPIIDSGVDSTIILGNEFEFNCYDAPLSEDYESDCCIPLDLIPDDDLPVLINPPRSQPPAQALILHLLFRGRDIDEIADVLSRLDDEFLYKTESRFWNRVRIPQLWQLNELAVLEILAAAQSSELWWEKTTDILSKEIPSSLQIMQSRIRANKVKQLARKSVENYFWWRFMGQRVHSDILTGHIIREFDN